MSLSVQNTSWEEASKLIFTLKPKKIEYRQQKNSLTKENPDNPRTMQSFVFWQNIFPIWPHVSPLRNYFTAVFLPGSNHCCIIVVVKHFFSWNINKIIYNSKMILKSASLGFLWCIYSDWEQSFNHMHRKPELRKIQNIERDRYKFIFLLLLYFEGPWESERYFT